MRKIAMIAFVLLLCCLGSTAFAQDTMPHFCGTLSPDDCAILTKSQQAMAALDSASVNLQVDATVSKLPNMSQPLTFNITGSGAYGGLNKLRSDALATPRDPGQILSAVFGDLAADISITINLPPEITSQARNVPSSITVQERLVDGIGYLNLDTLQGLMRNRALHGWYGLDLVNFFKAAMQQMPNAFNNPMSNMGSMQDYQKIFGDPNFINRFVQIKRTDDGSTSIATFEIDVNLGALMSSSDFQALMRQQMTKQNPSLSDTEINQRMTAASQMFKGMDITVTEGISTDDGYLHTIKGNFSFDTSGMMAAMNSSTGTTTTTSEAAPQIDLDFTYTYSNFNNAPAITAPPNAVIIPYQTLLRNSASA